MQSRRLLVLLTALNLVNYIDRWLVAAIIPPIQDELGLSNTAAGLIMSAFMLGYFVTSPFFGFLTDRINRIKIVVSGTTLWSLATVISGLGKTAPQIFISRTAVGVGEATLISASPSLLADVYPPEKLNSAMAILTSTIPVGSALGFIFGGFVAHTWGWRKAFFIAGAPGFLLAVIFFFFVKEPMRGTFDKAKNHISTTTFWKDVSDLLKNKKYVAVVLGYAAYTFTVGGIASWSPKYFVSIRGLELKAADTWLGALTVIMGFTGTLMGGWISGRVLKKKPRGDIWCAAIFTLLAIPFTFGAFLIPDKNGSFVAVGLAELFLFASQPSVIVATIESVGPLLRGLASAVSIFAIHLLGDFISAPLVGFLADKINLRAAVLILPTALFFALYFYSKSYLLFRKELTDTPLTQPIRQSLS